MEKWIFFIIWNISIGLMTIGIAEKINKIDFCKRNIKTNIIAILIMLELITFLLNSSVYIIQYFFNVNMHIFRLLNLVNFTFIIYIAMLCGGCCFFQLTRKKPNKNNVEEILRNFTVQQKIIVDQKFDLDEICQNEQFYKTMIYKQMDQAMFFYDVQKGNLIINEKAREMLGYSTEKIENRTLGDILTETGRERVEEYLRNNIESCIVDTVLELKTKSGAIINGMILANYRTDGASVYVQGAIRDITESFKRTQHFIRMNALLNSILSSTGNLAIFAVDNELTIITINELLRESINRHMGIKIENNVLLPKILELMKKSLKNINWVEQIGNDIKQALKGESITRVEKLQWKHSSAMYVQYDCGAIKTEKGQIIGCTTFLRDVTEQEEMKKKMIEAKEEAEKANQAKTQFLANMSHEIRTPMNGVLGLTDLMMQSKLDGTQEKYINLIQTSAKSLLEIINEILDFSKIECGHFILAKKVFHVGDLLEGIKEFFAIISQQKGIPFEYKVQDEVPLYLIGDPLRLRQILINLIGNSFKFTQKGGIFLNVYRESQVENELVLKFEVHDTGIGIAAEHIDMIFESFHQVQEQYSRTYGGTGLGLAICKQLIETMGGTIWATSEENIGSVFECMIPFCIATQNDIIQQHQNEKNETEQDMTTVEEIGENIHVLIAEDNIVNQLLIKELMLLNKWEATVVSNGKQAIEALKQRKYDLVLMDISMPVMDGLEAIKEIRKVKEWENITIIALTAHAIIGDKERLIQKGMDDYIAKPVDRKELSQIVYKHIKKNKINNKPMNNQQKNMHDIFLQMEQMLDGDKDLVKKLAEKIIEMFSNKEIQDIREKIYQRRHIEVKEKIHFWKGAVGNFYMEELIILLNKLGQYAYSNTFSEIDQTLQAVQSEIVKFQNGLDNYI